MKADKEHVRALVKMPDVLSAFGIQHDKHCIPCPLHNGKHRKFYWSEDKWYCHSKCGEGGDIFKFVMVYLNIGFAEALDWICSKFEIQNDGESDPEFDRRLAERRERDRKRKEAKAYQAYVFDRLCKYVDWLKTMPCTQIVENHIAWCDRLLDRMINHEVLFDGSDIFSDIDERLKAMVNQHESV